jgi:S-adenosylmethionine synthetase
LFVDLAAHFRVEVSGFGHDVLRDPFMQLAGHQLAVGVGQLKPQDPCHVEAAGRGERGDAAGQPDLIGDAAAERIRMHISGDLLRRLGLGEPHRLGGMQCGGDSPQLLQSGNPINPSRVADQAAVEDRAS